VTVYSGKVELGTGLQTVLTQIVAEELDVPMSRVTVIQGDTALTPDQGPTNASLSVQSGGMQLRRAAATARRALLKKAAALLGRDASTLCVRNGVVIAATGETLPIGKLVGRATLALEIDKDAPQKAPADYTIVGKPVPRLDIPGKVNGRFTFMQDFEKEEVTFDRSMVTSLDWASYPILTFPEIPEVIIDLIDRPSEVPWGGGEPSCAVVPSAIGGAVFEATGVRLRSLPFTPAKVKAAFGAG
jgi:CO/xanthine dehydrogenase Mo-binding subunit